MLSVHRWRKARFLSNRLHDVLARSHPRFSDPVEWRILEVTRNLLLRLRQRILADAESPERQWIRVEMQGYLRSRLCQFGISGRSCIEVGGSAHSGDAWSRYRSLTYPEFDLCNPPTDCPKADVVIAEQVLEHVVNPVTAVRTLRRLMNVNGILVVSTPFLFPIHEAPNDYWRFTPAGLRVLLESQGLGVEHVGSWGNRLAVLLSTIGTPEGRWWLPRKSVRTVPVVVWAVSRANPLELVPET